MPQMKVETRYSSELRNDAPESNCVTYDIRDESSPDSSPPLKGFLQNGQLVKSDPSQDSYNGSVHEDRILSVLSKNHDPALSDLDSYPSNIVNDIESAKVVNGHCSNDEDSNSNKGDITSSLFSDSLLSSLTCKPSKEGDMKVINGCNTQVFSDFSDLFPSISISDQGSKDDSEGKLNNFEVFNGHGVDNELPKSTSNKLNNFTTENNDQSSSILSSISCTELDVLQQNSYLNCPKQNGSEINNAGLLDILSSISLDETETSQKNSCSSPLNISHSIKSCDSNKLMSDFSFFNSHANTSSNLTPSELQNDGSLSDMLSSINFHENHKTTAHEHISTTPPNQNLENDFLFNLKELSTEFLGFKCCTPTDKCFSFSGKLNDASDKSNIDELLHLSLAIDTPKTTDPVNSFINDEKNFSFFSVSSDNVFSSMLTNLHCNLKQQDKNDDENADNISMLDLLKSVNTDSSTSLSGYLDIPSKTKEIQSASEDLSKILDIDLSGCIKTSKGAENFPQDLPVSDICMEVVDTDDVNLEDYIKPVFEEVESNRPRVNKSQSLFAKALSCKPKKNPELLRKSFYVKSELCKRYFNREFRDTAELDKNFKTKEDIYTYTEMVVCETNNCMITFKGRRFCPHEVK